MKPIHPPPRPDRRRLAAGVAIAHAIVGAPWIVCSDRMTAALVVGAAMLTQLQTDKGWLFIAATAFLLFLMLCMPARIDEDITQAAKRNWFPRWHCRGFYALTKSKRP